MMPAIRRRQAAVRLDASAESLDLHRAKYSAQGDIERIFLGLQLDGLIGQSEGSHVLLVDQELRGVFDRFDLVRRHHDDLWGPAEREPLPETIRAKGFGYRRQA